MKHFLIKYRLKDGSPEAWRDEIWRFIAAVEADQALNGRIAYRWMKAENGPTNITTPPPRRTTKRPGRSARLL